MATAFNMKSYIKNVVKSVGYVTIESAKELNPIISEFASTNSEVAKNIYSAAKNYKQIARQGKQSVADSEYTQIARDTVSNIISDLKTGNFYNKARQDKYGGGAALGIDLDDWDFSSLDVDLDNIDIDDDNSLTMSGMDDIGEKIVKGTGKASIQSADYIVRTSRANTKGIMAQNELLFANLNNTLGGINSTIISVGKSVLKPSMTHFENSSKFYAANTAQMAEQTGYLKQIYELINDRYNPKTQSSNRIKNRYANVMGSGSFDMEEYGDVIKENFKEMTSLITSMASMMSMGGQGNMLRYGLSSPISSLMKMGVTGIGKKAFGKDLERLNKSLTGLFGSSILKMNRMANKDSFSLAGLIGNLLGIKPSSKKGIDTGKYDKGRVDWSGKDAKALREVLPTQLALILSALTGQEAKVFNYETGKWVSYANAQKSLVSNVKNITKTNTRDIQDQFNKYFLDDNQNVNKSSKAFHTFQQDMNNFYHYLTMHNDRIPLNQNEWKDLEKRLTATGMFGSAANPNGMMLKSNFIRIKNYYARNVSNKKGYLNTTTNGALINSRNEVGKFYESHENDASSPYGMLFNSSGLGKPSKANMSTFAIDDKGNNVFFYLQSFYRTLERIADNTEGGIGGARRTSGRRRGVRSYDVPNNISKKSIVSKSDRFVDVDDAGANEQYYTQTNKKEKAEEMKDKFTDFLKNNKYFKRLGKGGELISAILDAPIKGLRSAIDYADNTMYNMVYGKDDKKDNPGILAKIMQGFDDTFKSIKATAKTFFKDTFSPFIAAFADKISNMLGFDNFGTMKGKIFNGIKNSGFVTGVKDNLKSAGKWAKNAVGGTLSDLDNYFTGGAVASNMKGLFGKVSGFGGKHIRPVVKAAGAVFNRGRNSGQAANGGFVTKSGMISVSEGEMIVPAERNPYYNGYVNKNIQIAKERSVANRWKSLSKDTSNYWGEYANGGTAEPRKNKSIVRMFKRGTRFVRERKTRATNKMRNSVDDASDTASQIVEDTLNDVRDTEIYKRTINIFDQVSSIVKNGAISVTTRLFGKTTDKDGNPLSENEMKKNTSDSMKAVWDEVKKHAPRMAAGGIIGGSAALLTGMVGGPLVGAAAGAAIGLATQSDAFREKLFGKGYKDGEYEGGVFGPKLSKLINERGAKLAKFGLTGGLGGMLGLIPGGPIAGILAGTALSFATESDGLKNYLFGDEGLLGKDTDKKVKKALPKMGLGAASLALTGPFGIIGNMMLGAGIGYVSESEKFKEAIFGVVDSNGQRQGGLLGTIRKEIIDPMGKYFKGGVKKFEDYMVEWVFKPVRNVLRPVGNMIGRGLNQVTDFLKGQFSDKIITPFMKRFDRLLGPVARVAGRVGRGAISIARNVGTLPGRALNRVGKELDRKAIRGGYSSLSAEERAMQGASDWYLSNNKYGTKEYDKRAASMNLDQLQSARDALEVYRGNVTGARVDSKEIRQNVMNRILADTKYGTTMKEDKLLRKELNNSISSGDLNLKSMNERVNQLVGSGKMEKDQARKLKQYLRTENRNLKDLSKHADQKRVTNKASKAAEQLGINLDDYMSDTGMRRLIGADLSRMKSSAKSKNPKELQSTIQDKATPTDLIIHPITEVRDVLTKTKDTLASKLDSILVTVGKIAGIDVPIDAHEENSSNSQNLKGIRRRIQTATVKNAKAEVDKRKEQEEENNTKIETTDDGSIIQYKKDSTGNWMANLRDSVTSKFLKNKRLESKMNQEMATTIISAGSVFTGLKALLFNKDKKKKDADPGLFDSLFGGKASGLKMIGGSLLATLGIGNLAHTLVPEDYKTGGGKKGNIITNTVRGFGDIQNVLTGHKPGTYKDGDYERQTIADRYVSQGLVKNSLMKGQTGNKILKAVPIIGKGTNAVLSGAGKVRNWGVDKIADTGIVQKGIKAASGTKAAGAIGSFATGGGELVRKGIQSVGNTKMGKIASAVGEKAGKAAGKVVDSGIMSKITSLASSALSKAFSLMGIKGGEAIAKEGAEQLGKAAAEAGAEKVAKSFAKSAALPVQIAFVAAAVENGFEDAKAILGIIDSPSMPERILAAAINGINEAVPGIGGVIPSEYIFNILFTLLNSTGLVDLSGLQAKREDAKTVVADYNQTNGTTYNVREYIKNVLGEYTTQEKIGRGLKKAGGAVVKGVKNLANAHSKLVKKGGGAIVKGAKFAIKSQLAAPKKAMEAVSKAKQEVVKSFGIVSKVVGDKLTPSKKFDMKVFIKNIWEYTDTRKHKDMNGIDELIKSPMVEKGTIGDVINATNATIVGGIMKFIVNMIRPFSAIKDFVGNVKNDIKESGGVGNWAKETAGKGINAIKNFFGWGSKSTESGSGSGVHVSQRDPSLAGARFGKRTIGENGCGPAAAATILNRYGRNGSLADTANYAKANGYVAGASGVGTKASYFGDILGSNGISSSYTSNGKDIKSAIRSGRPTVLLGQDNKNTSKRNSPFGPNNHYVVAQGMDRRGNVVIDDPELGGTALYKNKILNNAKLGVITGGDAGLGGGDYVGKYVKEFESGSKGSAMISSGKGDFGGVSFGTYQFPTKNKVAADGNLLLFWNKYYATQYPGVIPGNNQAFKSAWITAVNKDPSGFFKNEHEFVSGLYYNPIASKLASNGVGDPTGYDRAAQEAAWSTSVQYGATSAANLFAKAGVNSSMKPADYIKKLYDYKKNSVGTSFKSSSASMKSGIVSRFEKEKNLLLGIAGKGPIDPKSTNGASSTVGPASSGFNADSGASQSDNSSGDIGSILDNAINGVFTKVFSGLGSAGKTIGSIFGISSPSTESGDSTGADSSGTQNTNFSNSGNTKQENEIVNKMSSLFGQFGYSQKNRTNFTKNGSADCSSTVQHVLKSTIGVDPGGDTGSQLSSANGRIVDTGVGNGPKESNLKPGDLLFYKRSGSSKPKGVGHVEMYMGNGQRAGHGGGKNSPYGTIDGKGKGPYASSLDTDGKNYIEAKRFTTSASGSGLRLIDFTNNSNTAKGATNQVITNLNSGLNKVGGASGIVSSDSAKLIETALEYMKIIANNTSYNSNLKIIVEVLNSMMTILGGSIASRSSSSEENNEQAQKLESDMKNLMSKLKSLSSAV